jgi:hypothetical protein
MMLLVHSEKTAERHYRIDGVTADLVDHDVIDAAELVDMAVVEFEKINVPHVDSLPTLLSELRETLFALSTADGLPLVARHERFPRNRLKVAHKPLL